MNPLRIKQLLLLRPGQLVCMGLVLLFNHGYKTAIQYESCKNYLRCWIVPLRMQPVQIKQISKVNLKSINLRGMPFPASWSPRAISIRLSSVEYKVDISRKRTLKIFVDQFTIDNREDVLFSDEIGQLLRIGKLGDFKTLRSTFQNDHDLLESIFTAKMFPHIDSPILPLFPPVTGHLRQTFLLTSKALIARRDPIWKIKGKKRFFYILMGNRSKSCEIYSGSLVNGKLEAKLVIGSKQEKLTQELLIQLCNVLEQNSFDLQTPVRARKPIHKN